MDTITNVVNAFTERKVCFDVKIKGKGLSQRLRNIGVISKTRKFVIRPLTIGTMTRISELILRIDQDAFKSGDTLTAFHTLISSNSKTQAYIIALAITNSKEKPHNDLVEFLLYNLTAKELEALVAHVVDSMDIESFINSIISIRGINILEMNPQTAESTEIAPHGPLSAA
jgi:hypothetical protein